MYMALVIFVKKRGNHIQDTKKKEDYSYNIKENQEKWASPKVNHKGHSFSFYFFLLKKSNGVFLHIYRNGV